MDQFFSFSIYGLSAKRACHKSKVIKIFIISLVSVRGAQERFLFTRNSFNFLTHLGSKTSQFEIVFKSLVPMTYLLVITDSVQWSVPVGSPHICDGSWTYSNWHKMQIELVQFSTISFVKIELREKLSCYWYTIHCVRRWFSHRIF